MTNKEAMAKELEELAGRFSEGWHEGIKIDASDIMLLSQAAEVLAQPEQEPVVGTKTWFEDGKVITQYLHPSDIYIDPPQRTWVGLPEAKIRDVWLKGKDHGDDWTDVLALARSFEAELKELNT